MLIHNTNKKLTSNTYTKMFVITAWHSLYVAVTNFTTRGVGRVLRLSTSVGTRYWTSYLGNTNEVQRVACKPETFPLCHGDHKACL